MNEKIRLQNQILDASEREKEFPLLTHNDAAQHILDSFHPTILDYFLMRKKTTGVVTFNFLLREKKIRLFDVGCQRNERKKWSSILPEIKIFLYVVDLSQYDRLCYEDDVSNRMLESLEVFESIYHQYFHRDWFLIFTHSDAFIHKIQHLGNLKKIFEDYEGEANDAPAGIEFLKSKYQNISQTINGKNIPAFVINSLDTKDVQNMIEYLGPTLFEKQDPELINKESFKMVNKKSQLMKNEKEMIGEYELISRLGSGSFGIVYEVKKFNTEEVFALKSISIENENQLKMIQKEIEILQMLSHPNVITLEGYFTYEFYSTKKVAMLVILIYLKEIRCLFGNINIY
jgi:hypothetical protein